MILRKCYGFLLTAFIGAICMSGRSPEKEILPSAYLNSNSILQLGKVSQGLDPNGDELANIFLKHLADKGPDPEGNSPRIAKGKSSVLPLVDRLGVRCNDPQVDYLCSNGAKGQCPGFLSVSYDWAGHVIFRSDWGKNATWLFFEPGPRGSGHSDVATLNIQLKSKGEWLLTDPGYYSYLIYRRKKF